MHWDDTQLHVLKQGIKDVATFKEHDACVKYFWSMSIITSAVLCMQITCTLINILHFIEVMCKFTTHLVQCFFSRL